MCSAMRLVCNVGVLQPQGDRNPPGLGYSPFARHYLGNHVCFLFLPVLRCFSSRGSPPDTVGMTGLQPAGLPHSDIPESKVACTSSGLFAACHVFLRLPEPRHPPMCPFVLPVSPEPKKGTRHIPFSFRYCDRIL